MQALTSKSKWRALTGTAYLVLRLNFLQGRPDVLLASGRSEING